MATTIQPGFLARTWRALTNPTMQSKVTRAILAGAPIAAISKLLGAGWATSLGAGTAAGAAAWWAPKLDPAYRLQQKLLQLNPNAITAADNIYYASAALDEDASEAPSFTTSLQDIRNSEAYARARQAHEAASRGELVPLMRLKDQLKVARRELYRDAKYQLDRPGYDIEKAKYWAGRAMLAQFDKMTQKEKDYTTTLAKLYDARLSRRPWWSRLIP